MLGWVLPLLAVATFAQGQSLLAGLTTADLSAKPAVAATVAAGTASAALREFIAAYAQGNDEKIVSTALRLVELAPNDEATELAVRALSGQIESRGRGLTDAVPVIERALSQPIENPVTAFMLGHMLLAAVNAPGIALTEARAEQLSGRLPHWQLYGPFGKWQNLDFDHKLAVETTIAPTYTDGNEVRRPQEFESAGDTISMPEDWNNVGMDAAVSYVNAAHATRALLRIYSPASVVVTINGVEVLRNDRRRSYTPATSNAAVELKAGWNRVVVKLAGEASRYFDLMLRPSQAMGATGEALTDAAQMPGGSKLAGDPQLLAAPRTLAVWAEKQTADGKDAVAEWADGIRLMQDDDAEHGRVALTKATELAPESAAAWLDLARAYTLLPDASQSWTASQEEASSRHALKLDPHNPRAFDALGHVYQSQGKMPEAAQQYAQCAGKGFADCDWAEFRLAAQQRWVPEAETALGHALAESGSNWNNIVAGLEFYSSVGDQAKLAQWQRVLAGDPRAAVAAGGYDLRHDQAAEAARLLARAAAAEPSDVNVRRQYMEALLMAGDTAAAAKAASTALQDFPNDWRIAAEADEVALRENTARGIAQLRQTDYNRNMLRHEADFLTGAQFWQPWYHAAAEIIPDAPGKAEYPNANSILVFDQMVNRINADSTQDQYIHQIFRVLNAQGIAQLGDVKTITPGSDLITVRTIKADGTMLLPESVANLTSITMPGLEAGDYIEVEYVQHTPASAAIAGTLDNSEFFVFSSSQQPFHYSDYIVLTPPNYPLLVDEERFPTPAKVTTLPNGDTAREWLIQKTRVLVTEPNMPPEQNLVPKVWVSGATSWDDISNYYADHEFAVERVTPEMRAQAKALTAGKTTDVARADALFDWVAKNIQPGEGAMLVPARQFFQDRSGNRIATFLGMLAAVDVPDHLVMARGVTDDSSTKIPSVFQFQYPLIEVGSAAGEAKAPPGTGWYDLNGDFAQRGYIAAGVRGGMAMITGETGENEFTHVPEYESPLDGVALTVSGTVDDAGDAKLHLEMEFRGPNGEQVRQALRNQTDAQLPQVYQQLLLGSYPNATATGGKLINLAPAGDGAASLPLIVAIDATVPGFIQVNGSGPGAGWDIEHLVGAVGVLARYAPLPFRDEPLVIPGDTFEQTSVKLTLPARFGSASLPPAVNLQNQFGRFSSTFSQTGSQITFDRIMYLKAALIQPANYAAFRAFGEAVDNQDRLRLTGKTN